VLPRYTTPTPPLLMLAPLPRARPWYTGPELAEVRCYRGVEQAWGGVAGEGGAAEGGVGEGEGGVLALQNRLYRTLHVPEGAVLEGGGDHVIGALHGLGLGGEHGVRQPREEGEGTGRGGGGGEGGGAAGGKEGVGEGAGGEDVGGGQGPQNGRCQAGYCGPREARLGLVQARLARHLRCARGKGKHEGRASAG